MLTKPTRSKDIQVKPSESEKRITINNQRKLRRTKPAKPTREQTGDNQDLEAPIPKTDE